MNKDKLGQEPAFVYGHISKRLWIATMAMQGMISYGCNITQHPNISELAFKYADAMLEQEKGKGDE